LVAGHSENLTWLGHLFTPIGRTVYQACGKGSATKAEAAAIPRAAAASPNKSRVLARPESTPEQRDVTLMSGGIHASREPSTVRTLLGSCVAVCLYDPVTRVGGMNHFMLPDTAPSSLASAAYGVHAMELLINALMKLGGQRQRLVARVFGAANMLKGSQFDVPQSNARFALDFLERERIPVLEKRLGGEQPVWVYFSTHDGEARLRVVTGERARVAMNDQRHALHVRRDLAEPASNRVELF
jgi:chemotaxis receptor (MCP) glutamine deamidase CheD